MSARIPSNAPKIVTDKPDPAVDIKSGERKNLLAKTPANPNTGAQAHAALQKMKPSATGKPPVAARLHAKSGGTEGMKIAPRTPGQLKHEEAVKASVLKKVPWLKDLQVASENMKKMNAAENAKNAPAGKGVTGKDDE